MTVSTGNQHARIRGFAVRQIEVGRHMMPGPAFVNHILNPKTVPLQLSDHAGIEGRPFGKPADLRPEEIFHPLLVGFTVFRRFDVFIDCFPFREGFMRPFLQSLIHQTRFGCCTFQSGKHS